MPHLIVAGILGAVAGEVPFSIPPSQLLPDGVAPPLSTEVDSATPVKPSLVLDLYGDGSAEVVAFLSFHEDTVRVASDEVRVYAADGTLRWRYVVGRRVVYGDREFEGPWRLADHGVTRDPDGRARIWLAVIHDRWWPAFVVSVDAAGSPRKHLVHAGHLYAIGPVSTADGGRIVVSGVNNEHKSGVIALLDPHAATAVSPQTSPAYICNGCSGPAPL